MKKINFLKMFGVSTFAGFASLSALFSGISHADTPGATNHQVSFTHFRCPQLTSADFLSVGLPALHHSESSNWGNTCTYELLKPGTYRNPAPIASTFTITYRNSGHIQEGDVHNMKFHHKGLDMELESMQLNGHHTVIIHSTSTLTNPPTGDLAKTKGTNDIIRVASQDKKSCIIFHYNSLKENSKLSEDAVLLMANSLTPAE